jgi:hypothetical protein
VSLTKDIVAEPERLADHVLALDEAPDLRELTAALAV